MATTRAVQVEEPLARGLAFLTERQGADGLWRDFETPAGEASDWPTGFIGTRLLEAGERGTPIDAAADALLARQHRDGGWGYHRDVPSDADSTACVLGFLAAAESDRGAMERAGRCLRRHQDPRSGGVATYADPDPIRRYMRLGRGADLRGWCSRHLEVTAAAGLAFAAVPRGRFRPEAELAWRYVAEHRAADGTWGSYWWIGRHYPTLQAVTLARALGEREPAARAAEWALGDRGAPSAFLGALALAALVRGDGDRDAVRQGVLALVDRQEDDGGWPGQAVMRIPPPNVTEPGDYEPWRAEGPGTGVIVRDHHRLFTTSACVSALAAAAAS